jgi:hypothetical protein
MRWLKVSRIPQTWVVAREVLHGLNVVYSPIHGVRPLQVKVDEFATDPTDLARVKHLATCAQVLRSGASTRTWTVLAAGRHLHKDDQQDNDDDGECYAASDVHNAFLRLYFRGAALCG